MSHPDTPTHDFTVYSVGLVHASVCTNLTDEEATACLNTAHPTGLETGWEIAQEDFANGDPNGRPCNTSPATHRHLLFVC